MTPHARWLLRFVIIAVIIAGGALAIIATLASCTLVYIEGDGNSVSDTGGHGGGVTLPSRQQPTLSERMDSLRQSH